MITSKRDFMLEKRIASGIFHRNTLEKIHFDIIVLRKADIIVSRHIFCQGGDDVKNNVFYFWSTLCFAILIKQEARIKKSYLLDNYSLPSLNLHVVFNELSEAIKRLLCNLLHFELIVSYCQ